jgi:undecaprenyl-diphosphatase
MNIVQQAWADWSALELDFCERCNRQVRREWVNTTFATASRLGDGAAWILLIIGFTIFDSADHHVAAQLLTFGALALAAYKLIKLSSRRDRPLHRRPGLITTVAPLDRYSFPSGHTMHAVGFSSIALQHEPWLAILLVPLTILISASRVVLGLHYPTDVMVGAALGIALAQLSIKLV